MNTSTPTTARINPSTWNAPFRFDHAQLRPAPREVLTIAGQASVDDDGRVLHEGDVAAQLSLAVHHVEEILARVGMTLADTFSLTIYTTDIAATLAAYEALTERLDAHDATPPAALVGVAALALPGLAVEITAQAGR
ncbi:RidA family protein [Gordonia hankookensis]|uniref:RidA family protein n=1 Tax=Gordonia hankookensis TaxID=589403 RepID=A0ABR7W738_9ACTN|nr:RidA family protein [Gordonia hankookensis]MBD1318640.1 RidA family protein [Gordonia hankookensis]